MVLAVAGVCVCLYFCANCAGEMTGACFNPVLGIVNLTFVAIVKGDTQFLPYLPSYVFGPLLGAAVAALVCKFLIMPNVPEHYNNLIESVREENKSLIRHI